MALAEMVHMFPVFSRRIGITTGIGAIIWSLALGKMTGSLPVSKGRSAAWFSAFTALGAIAFWLFFYLF